MALRSTPARSLRATVLFAVALLSFSLPIALFPRESTDASSIAAHSEILAVPVARGAASVEDATLGRPTRNTAHSPSLACGVESYILDLGGIDCIRVRSTTPVVSLDPRVVPYDATAPPASNIVA